MDSSTTTVGGVIVPVSTAEAPLPQSYEAAKVALESCSRVDECQDWADKAAALASYARQADDDSLHQYAKRIQGRAVRRCGELLKQFDARGDNKKIESGDAPTFLPPTRRQVAEAAGLSKDQQVTAVRVASIPESAFEAAIESPAPPTVTALADLGRKPRGETPDPPPQPASAAPRPAGFGMATMALGTVGDFARFCRTHDPVRVAGGVLQHEVADALAQIRTIEFWLDRFSAHLEG